VINDGFKVYLGQSITYT